MIYNKDFIDKLPVVNRDGGLATPKTLWSDYMAFGITHQNKDVLFKILSENYKNKSLNVYGLDLPRIKEVLPTNLPTIQIDEKRSDNIFY